MEQYIKRRDHLKRHLGLNPVQARIKAAEEIVVPLEEAKLREEAKALGIDTVSHTGLRPGLLVDIARFPSLKAEAREICEWVAGNIANIDVQPESSPCPDAWALLHWVRNPSCPENERHFWTQIWPKILPSRAELNNQDRFRDDGKELDEFIGSALVRVQREAKEMTSKAHEAN